MLINENLEQRVETISNEFSHVEAVIVKVEISGQWSSLVSLFRLELEFFNFININYKNVLIMDDWNAKIKELSGEFN